MKKGFRGWSIAIALSIIFACGCGIMFNCVGVLFAAIIADTGYSPSSLSLYYSVRSLVSALIITFTYRTFLKIKKRNLLVAVCGILGGGSFAMMALYTQVWQWIISAVIGAVGISILNVIVPIIINNWFYSHRGVVLTSALAMAGVVSAIFSPICSSLVGRYGWRTTCVIIGVLAVFMWVIPALYFVVLTPEEVGQKPYGYEKMPKDENGAVTAKSYNVPVKIMLFIFIGLLLLNSMCNLGSQLPTYAMGLGYTLAVGATVTSCAMIGNISYKFIMGYVSDRIGGVKSAIIAGIAIFTGTLLLLAGGLSRLSLYAGALLFGGTYVMGSTFPPITIREIYGDAEYGDKLRAYQIYNYVGAMIASYLFPLLHDITGTWRTPIILSTGMSMCGVVLFNLVQRYLKKREESA